MSLQITKTNAAALATLSHIFCIPHGHTHLTTESWICGEAILARVPGSTGLANLKPVQAPPQLIEFANAYCADHPHTPASAGACLDDALRAKTEAAIGRLNDAEQRAAMAARTSNDDLSSMTSIATTNVATRGPYGCKNGPTAAKPGVPA